MTDIVKYKVLAASKGLARVLLRLDGRDTLDRRELGDELLLRRVVGGLPGVVVRARLINYDLEVVAPTAHDACDLSVRKGLQRRQVRLEQFFRRLQRSRVGRSAGRVGGVLAAPLARDLVEGDVATCASVVKSFYVVASSAAAATSPASGSQKVQRAQGGRPPLLHFGHGRAPGMVGIVRQGIRWI